jgi:hypothetical protein
LVISAVLLGIISPHNSHKKIDVVRLVLSSLAKNIAAKNETERRDVTIPFKGEKMTIVRSRPWTHNSVGEVVLY